MPSLPQGQHRVADAMTDLIGRDAVLVSPGLGAQPRVCGERVARGAVGEHCAVARDPVEDPADFLPPLREAQCSGLNPLGMAFHYAGEELVLAGAEVAGDARGSKQLGKVVGLPVGEEVDPRQDFLVQAWMTNRAQGAV